MKTLAILCLAATIIQLNVARFPDPRKTQFVHQPSHDVGEKLFLTPYIEANKVQEAKKAAEVHLGDFQNVASYSGYLTVDKERNGNLFFWFFPSASNYAEDPVLLWLQGGPGYTSLFGLFAENGPFGIENGKVALRNVSWHKNYSVLYIDQPVGTGFSFTEGEFVTDQTQVAEHLYNAMTQFFTLFSELRKNEFYISGESYGGRFIPALGYAIHQKNPGAALKINLQGLLIGNGFTDPIHQTQYGDLLYQLGLIGENTLKEFHDTEKLVVESIEKGLYQNATDYWRELVVDLFPQRTGLGSIYNYLKDVDDTPVEYEPFVIQDNVRRALHVGNQSFSISSDFVYDALYADISKTVAPWLGELLSHYRVLLFSGQLDIIVPYVSTENFLQHLNFSAAEEYKTAPRKISYFQNRVAGYAKTAGNLTEVLVRNAGHEVIWYQPEYAYDLVKKFTKKKSITGT